MGRETATILFGASMSAGVLSLPDAWAPVALFGLVVLGLPAAVAAGLVVARWRVDDRERSPARSRGAIAVSAGMAALIAVGCAATERPGMGATDPTPPTPHGDCFSDAGEIVPCPTLTATPAVGDAAATPSLGESDPTPAPTATSALGVGGEAVLVSVARARGDLTFNVIGRDGSSRLLGIVANPLAGRPKVSGAEGFLRGVIVGEGGFVVIPAIYGEEIVRLTVSDLKTAGPVTTADDAWLALLGPADRLAMGRITQMHELSEVVTLALANPADAPGLIPVPSKVRPVAWLASGDHALLAVRATGEEADGELVEEVGVLDAGGFRPGAAGPHFRTGLELPGAAASVARDPDADDTLDPSGDRWWRLSQDDGGFVLHRLDALGEPVPVARLTPTVDDGEEFWLRIVGISPDGSRIALGDGQVWPTARTRIVDTSTGDVAVFPGSFAGWADTP
jgi:hypothetical protein